MQVTDGATFTATILSLGIGTTGGTGTYNISSAPNGTYNSPGLTAGMPATIVLYPTAASAGTGSFECEGCRGILRSQIRVAYPGAENSTLLGASDVRSIIWHPAVSGIGVVQPYSRWSGNYYQPATFGSNLVATAGATIQCNWCSNLDGQMNISGGPHNVYALLSPGMANGYPTCTGGGATLNNYRVVAKTLDGSAIANNTAQIACGTGAAGSRTLSNTNYVTVGWSRTPGAEAYDVYGGAAGSEGYLVTIAEADSASNPITWIDNGSIMAGVAVPGSGTTGNANVDGLLGQGIFNGGWVGSISGSPTTVTGTLGFQSLSTSGVTGLVVRGQEVLTGTGVVRGSVIQYQTSGTPGGVGSYFVNSGYSTGSVTMTLARLLPACGSSYWGKTAWVSDHTGALANRTAYASGNKGVMVKVFCDTSNAWLVGG
jgi:hypothetical protein